MQNPKLEKRRENRLDRDQIERAVRSLLAFSNKSDLDLASEKIVVQIGLKRTIGARAEKPFVVNVPHPMREEKSACLLVKDADKPWIKAFVVEGQAPGQKSTLTKLDGTRAARMARRQEPSRASLKGESDEGSKIVEKVISLSKLRTSYARYEERRKLRDSYDVFFADDRILPMLTPVLGKTFFSRKKQPIPVRCNKSLPKQIENALNSTSCVLRPGNCVALRVAHADMPVEHIVDNVFEACDFLVTQKIPKQWTTVLNVSLKTPSSASLPVYSAASSEGLLEGEDKAAASTSANTEKMKKKRKSSAANEDDDEEAPQLIPIPPEEEESASSLKQRRKKLLLKKKRRQD